VANGGNMQFVTGAGDGATNRIANNVVNFAQRADLVLDLLENKADTRLTDYVDMWKGSLADFRNLSEVAAEDFLRQTAAFTGQPDARGEVREELSGEGIAAKSAEDLVKATPVELQLPRGVFTLLVVPREPTDIDISVSDARGNRVAMDRSLHWLGLVRIVNRHPQTYRLVGWAEGDGPAFEYRCEVRDWQCDPDEFNARMALIVGATILRTNEAPAFDARTSAKPLVGPSGSPARCGVSLSIPVPGVYVALGEVSAPLPIAMTLGDGGLPLDGNTLPTTEGGGEPIRSQIPLLVFRVLEPDAKVRFDCEAPAIEPDDGPVESMVRVMGWPGIEMPADGGR
jgi:hypothetical protein